MLIPNVVSISETELDELLKSFHIERRGTKGIDMKTEEILGKVKYNREGIASELEQKVIDLIRYCYESVVYLGGVILVDSHSLPSVEIMELNREYLKFKSALSLSRALLDSLVRERLNEWTDSLIVFDDNHNLYFIKSYLVEGNEKIFQFFI